METGKVEQTAVNEGRTSGRIDTRLTQRPARYELIDKDGYLINSDESAAFLAEQAKVRWPDQEQDPDRTGKGWDIQVCSNDLPAASRASHCS